MKMVAPSEIGHLNFDNVEYERDEDGLFEIKHPDHIAAAHMHGLVPYDPSAPHLGLDAVARVEPVKTDFDEQLSAKDAVISDKDDEIAQLKAQLAAAQAAPVAPVAPAGTDAPAGGAAAPGDTSEKSGGVAEEKDLMAEALAADPNFDEMGRDDLVDWLKGVGVSVPGNLSTDKAREIVDSTIADYKAGLEKGE